MYPVTQNPIQGVLAAAVVVGHILGVSRASTLVGDLVAFVAVVHINHVALLGEFNPVHVWRL